MTKGINIVNSCYVWFNYYVWFSFLPLNHRFLLVVFILIMVRVIAIIIFQCIKNTGLHKT